MPPMCGAPAHRPAAADWGQGLWPHASRLDAPLRLAPGRVALDHQITALGDLLTRGEYCEQNRNRFLQHQRSDCEHLILENRRHQGRDVMLPGSGLAAWYGDELGSNARPLHAPEGHRHADCMLLQAAGAALVRRHAHRPADPPDSGRRRRTAVHG